LTNANCAGDFYYWYSFARGLFFAIFYQSANRTEINCEKRMEQGGGGP